MPRLSIIIPHRRNDRRLEATLLSVLENRPADSEVIVVHDGSYRDPYALSDEVVFVQEDPGSRTIDLLNAGLLATCSPAICVMLDGTLVESGWAESPLHELDEQQVASVAVAVRYRGSETKSLGIDAAALGNPARLQSGRFDSVRPSGVCCGPKLACGFYRRQVLLSLGGWNASLDETTADLELAWALNALGLRSAVDENTVTEVEESSRSRRLSPVALGHVASLSVAHGVEIPSLLNLFNRFAQDCLKGRPLSAFAWARGLRDANTIRRAQLRLAHAKQRLTAEHDATEAPRIFRHESSPATTHRRAA